jgi:2-keto-4-pentenoate hydratase/2-oxohepta-3-ene-1,7-dioic acid hydratase in catechol pathway
MSDKIVRFERDSDIFWGVYNENEMTVNIVEGNLFEDFIVTERKFDFKNVRLLAPVQPEKIICVGLNYQKHVSHSQSADKAPDEPLLFMKPPSSLLGHEGIVIYPDFVDRVDYEAELGVVIGKKIRNVTPDEAAKAIFGLICVNDVTARHLQKKDGQWTRAKGFDTFCPAGPWVVTDTGWSDLKVEAYLNGELKQSGRTSDMIFKPEVLISFISKVMTLKPGDLISTGTPEGIDPMKVGDKIEVVVENVGRLINYIGE